MRITSTILAGLGLTTGEDGQHLVQYFNLALCRWSNIFQGHVVVLQSPQVYLRNVGVSKMPDFDDIIAQYSASSTSSPSTNVPHLRTNLASERTSVHRANHQQLTRQSRTISKTLPDVIELASSSSDDEHDTSSSKRSLKARHSRPQPTFLELPSDWDPASPPIPSPSSSPSVRHSVFDPIDLDSCGSAPARVWPRDFYTLEVAEVFCALSAPGINAKQAFSQTYGPAVTFHASTFSEHLKRWNTSSVTSRMKFIDAGETEEGKYVLFMKANPSPDGEVKAAKKRLACHHKH